MKYEFVMWVSLLAGEPGVPIPVHDCKEVYVWAKEASEWARRSGLSNNPGQLAVCAREGWTPSGLSLSSGLLSLKPDRPRWRRWLGL